MRTILRLLAWISCRRFSYWLAIIGVFCIIYAGCADNTVQHTNLTIDNLRVDSISNDFVMVAFTINEPATIFWALYAHNASPRDVDTVINNARSSSSDPMIIQNGAQEERSDAGRHIIKLTNLPREQSYNLYVAAIDANGIKRLADAVPITTANNISNVDITRIHSKAIQITWNNPIAQGGNILEKIVIDWTASNNYVDDASNTSGSYLATEILAAEAKARATLPILSARFFDYQISLTVVYRDGSTPPPFKANYRYIIDDDGDKLIDIYTMEDLNSIRCNPSGTAYHIVGPDGTCSEFSIRCGIDGATECTGYELRRDLNFSERASYEKNAINPNWRPNTASDTSGRFTTANDGKNSGWLPIENITTIFEGNGHSIENLYVRDTTADDDVFSGLFAKISTNTAHIKNLTLASATIYGGTGNHSHVGALAGELNGGTIEDVAVIGGMVDGGDGDLDLVGGLVGQNTNRGTIRNSYTTGNADGGDGNVDLVGGLVGRNNAYGMITDNRATGTVDGGGGHADQVGDLIGIHIDDDGDGLIDIDTLEDLNSIRCNPSGTAYQAISLDGTCFDFEIRCGADGTTSCTGYELRRNLNFSESVSYATGTVNSNWRPNATSSNRGWVPIENITTTFEGNSHTIENLYVRDTTADDNVFSGLFAKISTNTAHIKNFTLASATIYGGTGNHSHVGALAGELNGGTIENVAVIGGTIHGENGRADQVGGLVGQNTNSGTVRNSYATSTVDGGEGDADTVGGLVGVSKKNSTITASYATGNADGGGSYNDYVGGLVGTNFNGSAIIASYATGDADGGDGYTDYVGGLVGQNFKSAIIASYATGNADGGESYNDYVGGLVGNNDGSTIIASYATGDADGGKGNGDYVGGLVGYQNNSTITASYATGDADGGDGDTDRVGGLLGSSNDDNTISASYATGDASNGATGQTNALVGFKTSAGSLTIKNSYGFGSGGKEYSSTLPHGASRASDLTAPVASNPPNTAVPQVWDSAAENSKDAWDFGTSAQTPALRYADYDGSGSTYNCNQFPEPCGTLIPGQRE